MTTKRVNHWGIWVDPGKPVTGVISINRVSQFVSDEICGANSVDLGYIEAKNEFILDFQKHHKARLPNDQELEDFTNEFESSPSDCLIGSWKLDRFGKYEHDESGEFSAVVREDVVQVIWSKYVTKCKNLCSPCYPGQADIESGEDEPGGKFLAYNLPPGAYPELEQKCANSHYCNECEKQLLVKRAIGSVYYYYCDICNKTYKIEQDIPEFPFGEFDNGKHWQGESV